MVEKDENRLRVTLRTMVNGYMLEVNDEGYMYFDDQSLLEGFCIHVGMNRLEAMTMVEIKDMLSAEETEWLNAYHQHVFDTLSPYIDADEVAWLQDQTQAL